MGCLMDLVTHLIAALAAATTFIAFPEAYMLVAVVFAAVWVAVYLLNKCLS